jgi:hypothetical protein
MAQKQKRKPGQWVKISALKSQLCCAANTALALHSVHWPLVSIHMNILILLPETAITNKAKLRIF